jgi:predicted RNase H-like nuclease (RuvC/YqgF family)
MSNSAYSSVNNKEFKIRDLQSENKSLRAERELVKKDNMKLRNQVDSLEKIIEKGKLGTTNQSEIVHLTNDLKRKESKIVALKEKKREM